MVIYSDLCITGKQPVRWLDLTHHLQSPYLIRLDLVDRAFDREFEQAMWEAGAPRRG